MMTIFETLRKHLLPINISTFFIAAWLPPAHYFDREWKSYVTCPSGYALEISVHEYKPLVASVETQEWREYNHERYVKFDEKCHGLTQPGKTTDSKAPLILIALPLNLLFTFFLIWMLFHWVANIKTLPSALYSRLVRLNIYSALAFITLPPLCLQLFDLDWLHALNRAIPRPIFSCA